MRLNRKKQILEFISTIEEGIDYVSYTGEMIQDCNDSLVFLSNLLSEEHEVRELIQKAIDAVQCLEPGMQKEQSFITHVNNIKIIVNNVRTRIINDIKTDIEIAFMPYKASMWDSLESIYREAEKDPNCTCYVVPIPYYEKNAQGEIVKFCYEGNELPKDINTIPFDVYDFENRRPDVIYIHNPFDQYNKLTMVYPRFFSDNLAQYTDMLVYVPYYVAGSASTPELYGVPSFNNVTKIIVQSEILKDAYVANGTKADKVLVLGSPKLDAMFNALSDHREAPLHWQSTIRNKKVILFNTGIADLLNIDTWFEQAEYILNYFMDHEKYVLIWRPHPLTEITIKTMRPQLLEIYVELENRLKKATNIIIDTSSDIYQAVAISDAIISDYSSVMLQYIITEKPVLGLLSKNKLEQDTYYYADYLGCYFTNEDISVAQFVDMVECNEDFKKEERISRFKKSVVHADGTCGQRIHQVILNEITNN